MKVSKKLFVIILVCILSISAFVLPVYATTNETADTKEPTKIVEVTKDDIFYWEMIDNEWVCTDESGEAKTGWAYKNDNKYFLNKDGKIKTGWIKDKGNWYYLYSEKDNVKEELFGTLATDTWIDNYYVDKNGIQRKIKK